MKTAGSLFGGFLCLFLPGVQPGALPGLVELFANVCMKSAGFARGREDGTLAVARKGIPTLKGYGS